MTRTLSHLVSETRSHWRKMLLHGIIVALLFQAIMLIALIVRFQAFPNYFHVHDWVGSITHIIASTPSWADIFSISVEEWFLEIGQMNFDYGMGLSIWSLNVVPSRLLVLTILGALLSLCYKLILNKQCSISANSADANPLFNTGTGATLLGGSVLVAMTNATMSWVVCCATPSWVVGLAMLGLSVPLSLALESLGPVLSFSGFSLLLTLVFFLAWRNSRTTPVFDEQDPLLTVAKHA